MTRIGRKFYLLFIFLLLATAQLYATVYEKELYPFNPSMMYRHKRTYKDLKRFHFVGISSDLTEAPLKDTDVRPLDLERLRSNFRKARRSPNKKSLYQRNIKALFELMKEKKSISQEKYVGIRVFLLKWSNRQALIDDQPSQREFIGEHFN